ncbi:MAG: MFS transporter [Candidatus Micrarchaeia archaeon]|jgi:MFS family permease
MKKPEKREEKSGWLNSNVLGAGISSFFGDLSYESATAILPAFLAALGVPAAVLGAIEGISDGISSFVKLGSGWLSDKLRARKKIAGAGYLLGIVSQIGYAVSASGLHVLVSRATGWAGRGLRGPARDAILSDSVEEKDRGKAFGFHRAGDTLGAVLGPLFAFWLLQSLGLGFGEVFWITVIPAVLAAGAFWLLVREKRETASYGTRPLNFLEALGGMPQKFRGYLSAVFIFGIADFSHTLLILRATELFTPEMGVVAAGGIAVGLYAARNVVYAAASYPIGALSDRIGRKKLLAAGYAVAAITMAGFAFAQADWILLLLLFCLAGLYIAAEDTLEGAIAGDILPKKVKGTGFGVLAATNGVGDFVSSIAVGVIWTAVSPQAAFTIAAVVAGMGALLMATSKFDH